MEKKNYSAKIKDVFGGMRTVRAYFFFFFFLVLVLFSLVIPLSIQKEKHLSENMESQYLYGLLLILLSLTFVFCVDDLLVLFIFFELSVVPFFFYGCSRWSKKKTVWFKLKLEWLRKS